MENKKITRVALIAAVYTVMTLILAPFSFGPIQVRLSESLTVLPLFSTLGIYGITLGCFLSNILGALMGSNPLGYIDAIIGSCASLLAGIMTYKLRNKKIKGIPFLSLLMPLIFNFIFVGLELAILYMPENILTGLLIYGLQVALGELVAVIIGYFVIYRSNLLNRFF